VKKENILIRLLGLFVFLIGGYWFWKNGFAFIPVGGIPLPLQIIVMTIGGLTLISPAPFLNIVALFLPSETSKRLTEFVSTQLTTRETKQVVFQPHDEGEVLSEKLNKAVKDSKRRFYVGVVTALIFIPLLIFYIYWYADKQQEISRDCNDLVKAAQNFRIDYSDFDEFHRILNEKISIKGLTPEESTTRRIYGILDQLFNNATDQISFENAAANVYNNEIQTLFSSGPFDVNKIKAPVSPSDPSDAIPTLYILLANICNIASENGSNPTKVLYGRGILDELFERYKTLPPVAYNINGINYSNLLNSIKIGGHDKNAELISSIFHKNEFPSVSFLASRATDQFKKYIKNDKSNLGKVRSLNNIVDVYLICFYLYKVKGEGFNNDDSIDPELSAAMRNPDIQKVFGDLEDRLKEANESNLHHTWVVNLTKAQLYSIEGQIIEKQPGASQKQLVEDLRTKGKDAIKEADIKGMPKDYLTDEKKENLNLTWLDKTAETNPNSADANKTLPNSKVATK
jgi:hypothetical protein